MLASLADGDTVSWATGEIVEGADTGVGSGAEGLLESETLGVADGDGMSWEDMKLSNCRLWEEGSGKGDAVMVAAGAEDGEEVSTCTAGLIDGEAVEPVTGVFSLGSGVGPGVFPEGAKDGVDTKSVGVVPVGLGPRELPDERLSVCVKGVTGVLLKLLGSVKLELSVGVDLELGMLLLVLEEVLVVLLVLELGVDVRDVESSVDVVIVELSEVTESEVVSELEELVSSDTTEVVLSGVTSEVVLSSVAVVVSSGMVDVDTELGVGELVVVLGKRVGVENEVTEVVEDVELVLELELWLELELDKWNLNLN
ncbi:hypothetical protein Ct61P_12774 [Colletotrichum tofieldiae]|nr:hypothetical protein Ct61P_12774 [Colletotrichum tofieldiae]